MGAFLVFAAIVLLFTVLVLIGKTSEISKAVSGTNLDNYNNESKWQGYFLLSFIIAFFISIFFQVKILAPMMIPKSASYHGDETDRLFYVTLFFMTVVFFLTQAVLFYFAYRYNQSKNKTAYFYSHNNKLEIVWTVIPSIVLTILVVMGMMAWFKIFNVDARAKDAQVIEVTAKQFGWTIRYPGVDGKFGKRIIDKEHISSINELGVDWTDANSHDDVYGDKIVLIKDKPVLVKLGALDVLHSFYLPHFRVKMDCVPGIPTQFYFTPKYTTEEMRNYLSTLPWWQANHPETGEPRWKNFKYELACAELCGKSHYGMMKEVVVLKDEKEYKEWMAKQASYYNSTIKPEMEKAGVTPVATAKAVAKPIDLELEGGVKLTGSLEGGIEHRLIEFIKSDKEVSKDMWFSFDRLLFETGKSTLKPESQEQLVNVVAILKAFPNVNIKLGGYTDNVGNPAANLKLSDDRAKNVMAELVKNGIDASRLGAEGYGQEHPVCPANDTDECKAQNRRIDIRVTKK